MTKEIYNSLDRIIRPVISKTIESGSYYGTGFLMKTSKDFYFFTALHVLKNWQLQLSSIHILQNPKTRGLKEFTFDTPIRILNSDESPVGANDTMAFPLNKQEVLQEKLEGEFWNVMDTDSNFRLGMRVCAIGFPESEQESPDDIENSPWRFQSCGVDGSISSISESDGLITVDTNISSDIKCFQSFSGSPVFSLNSYKLLGIVQAGGRTANKLHFLSIAYLINLLKKRENPSEEYETEKWDDVIGISKKTTT